MRQITLLNLGRHSDLPQPEWPRLGARIEALLSGQSVMLAAATARSNAGLNASPPASVGLRPVFHHTEPRSERHLFITGLAYQLVQAIRRRLKHAGQNASWASLREMLSVQQRITATFQQRDGRTLHARKTTAAEPERRKIYDALAVDPVPAGVRKYAA